MKVCLRVLKGAKKYWIYIFIGMISVIVSTLLQLYSPWVIRELTALAINGDPEIASKSLVMGLTLLATYILMCFCSFTRGYFTHYGAYHYVADLRTALYNKMQHLSMGYYNDKQTGQLASRIMNDVVNTELLIAHAVPDLIVNVLTLGSVAVILFLINVKLAFISLIAIPFLMAANVGYSKYVRPQWRLNQKALGELSGALHDNLSGMKEIQVFNQQDYETEKIASLARNQTNAFLNATKMGELFHPSIVFLSSVGSVAVIIYGGYLNSIGEASIADIVGFIMYLTLFYQPITNLSGVNENLNNAIAGCERVFEVMDEVSSVQEKPNPTELKNVKGAVEFCNLTFHYNPDLTVLCGINLKIKPGQTVALVGTTGVGKSTIASLLNRFYDPVEGEIRVDGINIRDVSLKSLRDNVSMVLQDTFLFTGTVYENIAYSCKNASRKQVIEASKAANAHEFIETLENGYKTLIGERGVRLSGGQKQRISIARALLRNAPILILDEATSSLDTKTEREIQHSLEYLFKGRTTLVIAHRLSTIRSADQIVVLDGSGIAEQGTHDELLQKCGSYAKLCSMQAS
ncbi:ABC transporter ATP-binding protein [Clostridium sp. CF012]|uniref:ABC transporter ATP-binding protein n=1 Tax=Clostridium sp. CF012 TaxID=2843319 RepID=UPI001C0D4750|nr:ABC transporter ATP-binding protein [Clostridium sp. CF012]MBU3143056.1 ABC transporter ATP-binding protein/permease [Clostridium sp. CF012]